MLFENDGLGEDIDLKDGVFVRRFHDKRIVLFERFGSRVKMRKS